MKEIPSPVTMSAPKSTQATQKKDSASASGMGQPGASFDTSASLSGLKRLQDASMFEKARFRFRLYRK